MLTKQDCYAKYVYVRALRLEVDIMSKERT